VATLVERNACINNFDNSLHPYGNLFKNVSEVDFFTLLVSIDPPPFRDTSLLLSLRGFLNLMDRPDVSRVGLISSQTENYILL